MDANGVMASKTFSVALLILATAASRAVAQAPLRVVEEVDFERYAGTWFEIARLPFKYQEKCASDVTATYEPRPDGLITVTNRCREANGQMREAEGVARRVEGRPASVLKVRFAPAFLSFLPMVWGDYQVIVLGADYDHVMVGTPDRKYLWILARTRHIDEALYRSLVEQARSQGFDVTALIKTRHTATS
jgi:apolipoprotein D and lipocalin family protein